jgi:hypothetical protein
MHEDHLENRNFWEKNSKFHKRQKASNSLSKSLPQPWVSLSYPKKTSHNQRCLSQAHPKKKSGRKLIEKLDRLTTDKWLPFASAYNEPKPVKNGT